MNPRVLLADDSATMRKIIVRLLDEIGVYAPTEAPDGAEAVKMFEVGKFDLILTDWNMPNKNGIDVVRDIRKLDPLIPIIMITTEAEQRRVSEALDAGVSDYIVKPFDREKLRAKIEDNLNKKKPVETLPEWHPQFVSRANPVASPPWGSKKP
jgi:two-component system, chemotaxis family, chemotaxis protein CheY